MEIQHTAFDNKNVLETEPQEKYEMDIIPIHNSNSETGYFAQDIRLLGSGDVQDDRMTTLEKRIQHKKMIPGKTIQ